MPRNNGQHTGMQYPQLRENRIMETGVAKPEPLHGGRRDLIGAEIDLHGILSDDSGGDMAEFILVDEENDTRCFRLRPYQVRWFRDRSRFQIEKLARDLGKALDIYTPIPTPTGWTMMGELEVGDEVLGSNGRPTKITKAFDVLYDRTCYEVSFDDGESIVADSDHLWSACQKRELGTGYQRPLTVRTTDLMEGEWAIRNPLPLQLNPLLLDEDPYEVGRSLGSWNRHGQLSVGRELPIEYLRASREQRLAVLRGYMDAVGKYDQRKCQFSSLDPTVAADMSELLRSLGQAPRSSTKISRVNGGFSVDIVTVKWTATGDINPFLSDTKSRFPRVISGRGYRRIVSVKLVDSRPVRCITVDASDHLFLAGKSMIPTHNSVSLTLRAMAWPYNFPGQDMFVTGPKLVHIKPLTQRMEFMFLRSGSRLLNEFLLQNNKSQGIERSPAWSITFANGARIVTRIPNHDGQGVKGSCGSGTLVLTMVEGQKTIEAIEVGEFILTHRGRYMPVVETYSYPITDAVKVGFDDGTSIVVSSNHRMMRLIEDERWARSLVTSEDFVGSRVVRANEFSGNVPCPSPPTDISPLEALRLAGEHANTGKTDVEWVRENFTADLVPTWLLATPESARQSFLIGARLETALLSRRDFLTAYMIEHSLKPDGNWATVVSVEPIEGETMVHDLVVDEDYSYVAEGMIHFGSMG